MSLPIREYEGDLIRITPKILLFGASRGTTIKKKKKNRPIISSQ